MQDVRERHVRMRDAETEYWYETHSYWYETHPYGTFCESLRFLMLKV